MALLSTKFGEAVFESVAFTVPGECNTNSTESLWPVRSIRPTVISGINHVELFVSFAVLFAAQMTSLDSIKISKQWAMSFDIYKQQWLLLMLLATCNCDSEDSIYLPNHFLCMYPSITSFHPHNNFMKVDIISIIVRKLIFKGWKLTSLIKQVKDKPRFEPSSSLFFTIKSIQLYCYPAIWTGFCVITLSWFGSTRQKKQKLLEILEWNELSFVLLLFTCHFSISRHSFVNRALSR